MTARATVTAGLLWAPEMRPLRDHRETPPHHDGVPVVDPPPPAAGASPTLATTPSPRRIRTKVPNTTPRSSLDFTISPPFSQPMPPIPIPCAPPAACVLEWNRTGGLRILWRLCPHPRDAGPGEGPAPVRIRSGRRDVPRSPRKRSWKPCAASPPWRPWGTAPLADLPPVRRHRERSGCSDAPEGTGPGPEGGPPVPPGTPVRRDPGSPGGAARRPAAAAVPGAPEPRMGPGAAAPVPLLLLRGAAPGLGSAGGPVCAGRGELLRRETRRPPPPAPGSGGPVRSRRT